VNNTVVTAVPPAPLVVVVIDTGPVVGVGVEPVVHRTSVGDTWVVVAHATPAIVRIAMSAAVRPSAVPVIVTTVPPVIGPEVGVTEVIKGPPGITTGPPVYANPRAGMVVVNTPPEGDDTVTGDWATGLDTGAVVHVTSVADTTANVEH
jgi:hypothetical protein